MAQYILVMFHDCENIYLTFVLEQDFMTTDKTIISDFLQLYLARPHDFSSSCVIAHSTYILRVVFTDNYLYVVDDSQQNKRELFPYYSSKKNKHS